MSDDVDTFVIKFYSGEETSWFETTKCHQGSINFFNLNQNEIKIENLDPNYSSKLIDFISLCYDLNTVKPAAFANACGNGNLVNDTCFCEMGFRGDRCQFSNLAELDCSPGFSKFGKNQEAMCHCPTTTGGLKYCGVNPCGSSCLICARHRDGIKCDNTVIQSELFTDIFYEYGTSNAPLSPSQSTILEEVELNCGKNGKLIGKSCTCLNGYFGEKCQLAPVTVNCEYNQVQVKLADSYPDYMANYYVPGGKFVSCQTASDCAKGCPLSYETVDKESPKVNLVGTHAWEECGSILTKRHNTMAIENNIFWQVPNSPKFIKVAHYECIYHHTFGINAENIKPDCCIDTHAHIIGHENLIVTPVMWRPTEDGYEVIHDDSR